MIKRKVENVSQNNFDFWDGWKNITPIEQKAINATKIARELVIRSTPLETLVAIYVKGSFTRREMNQVSDVDMVPIVTENKYESRVFKVNGAEIAPVMAVPLSLEEFRASQLATKSEESVDLRAKPDRFLRMIKECRLIFGTAINPHDYPIRTDQDAYRDEINIITNGYIPLYLKGEIDFAPLLKEFFWATEMELSSKGIQVPHTFGGIAQGAGKDHLIHEALKLRHQVLLDKPIELEFVNKLQTLLLIK